MPLLSLLPFSSSRPLPFPSLFYLTVRLKSWLRISLDFKDGRVEIFRGEVQGEDFAVFCGFNSVAEEGVEVAGAYEHDLVEAREWRDKGDSRRGRGEGREETTQVRREGGERKMRRM
eukprot:1321812-Amorphochlora_amoeboformis.AAC.1